MKQKEFLCSIPIEEFLEQHNLTLREFETTTLKSDELNEIAKDFDSQRPQLSHTANFIANSLQGIPAVHSVKVRLKSQEGLIAKIIRKRIEDAERIITIENYRREITDLVGARALHLLKDQWKPVSDYIRANWEAHEAPVAYHRRGDPGEVIAAFNSADLVPQEHQAGYRSIHHVIKCSPTKLVHLVEIQVRSLMEEAWSEIDHRVRYPRKSDDKELDAFLMLFNSVAGTADLMGTFLMNLRGRLNEHSTEIASLNGRVRAAEAEVQATVSKLNIGEKERRQLEAEIAKLTALKTTPYIYSSEGTGAIFMAASGGSASADLSKISPLFIQPSPFGGSLVLGDKTCSKGHTLSRPPNAAISLQFCPQCGELVP
jgi:putative GTP pyrophosphokinase